MSNEEILKKAIEKAESNGFPINDWDFMIKRTGEVYDTAWLPSLLFNHTFAKAFWGIERLSPEGLEVGMDIWMPAWKIRLQQMVLEEDPIKYLEKFL